uniref:SREBP regulating gene protein n=1 Tax=Parascaris univalens TaxID=6257 RepID=A0A915BZ46_PARUN
MVQAVRRLVRVVQRTSFLYSLLTFSFIYFLARSGLLLWIIRSTIQTQDVEERMLDKYKRTAHRHIQWLADSAWKTGSDTNETTGETACRNTRQGKTTVTDDRGYTCDRSYLMLNGCCEVIPLSVRFNCDGCDLHSGCCSFYEHCVGCCMRPDQKEILLEMIESTSGHRLRQILSATDQFELCTLKCRTSSNSVHSENKYKSEALKYCYKQEPNHPFSR